MIAFRFELWLERLQHGRVTRFVFWPLYVAGYWVFAVVLSCLFIVASSAVVVGLYELLHWLRAAVVG